MNLHIILETAHDAFGDSEESVRLEIMRILGEIIEDDFLPREGHEYKLKDKGGVLVGIVRWENTEQ